ncbi:hypothetical protein RHMOL_Rhmol08G0249500 [Rhododendron molle]|uniref:Uncharacterized protein n=1 Tax=Rhododendron molle TaxID=49168 RepID=A0ACC0MS06_RHOML|nr:hypothetical protein RHMOL_Rhmol08G0249500 [Rhododendron molle]
MSSQQQAPKAKPRQVGTWSVCTVSPYSKRKTINLSTQIFPSQSVHDLCMKNLSH